MKHVFRISSHLTFYLCKSYIEEKMLNHNECVLFLVRNYMIPSIQDAEFQNQIHTSYNVDKKNGRIFAGLNIVETHKNIRKFDDLVDSYIKNDSFIWYTQVCNDDLCSMMVTKDNCQGYYVIEDGLGSYLKKNPQTFEGSRYWIYKLLLKPFYHRIFEVKNWFINSEHPKFLGCIASSQKCFPLHQQFLHVVDVKYDKCELEEKPDAILSVDPLYFFIDEKSVNAVYRDLSVFMEKKGYKVLYYKFHPYFNNEVNLSLKKSYESMILSNFKMRLKEIQADKALENIIFTYKCDFYTNHSSVSIYGSQMGAICYSYSSLIKKHVPNYDEIPIVKDFCVMVEY